MANADAFKKAMDEYFSVSRAVGIVLRRAAEHYRLGDCTFLEAHAEIEDTLSAICEAADRLRYSLANMHDARKFE